MRCILFHFYIKPQRFIFIQKNMLSCILFHFYIKPQPAHAHQDESWVVSYSISTSNHNRYNNWRKDMLLYLIPFLHQTTTDKYQCRSRYRLYLIPFLHQTTTDTDSNGSVISCILFHFYIKPQRLSLPIQR